MSIFSETESATNEMPLGETFEQLQAEIVEEGTREEYESKKSKRGRPRGTSTRAKAETVSDTVTVFPPEIVRKLCEFPFVYLAARRGSHWNLSEKELDLISDLGGKVINKNAPDWLEKYGDEIALSVILGGTFYARIQEDKRLTIIRKSNEAVPVGFTQL